MKTIRFSLQRIAETYADRPALIGAERMISYAEYHRQVHTVADNLIQIGIERQERLGIILDNSIEYILLLMAAFQIGAIACPISPRFPEKTINTLLEKINCKKLVAGPYHRSKSYKATTFELAALLNPLESLAGKTISKEIDVEQDATIIFTSGSKAEPKAVLHTLANHYYNALGANDNMPLQPRDRWLLSLPLYHVGGMGIVFRCLLSGAAVVVPARNDRMTAIILRHRVTHVSLVPTQLKRLLDDTVSGETATCLKHVLVGGSAVPQDLIRRAKESGFELHTSYGLSEMASQVTTTALADSPEKLFTSGRILKYRELKLSPENEIRVRGKTRFKGYVEKKSLITPFDEDGWFGTCDLGVMDVEGYLMVFGRKDNMFISGGENIQPEEIERILGRLAIVDQAMVVPVKDSEYGQRPVAFIRAAGEREIIAEDIIHFLQEYLPRFKIPVGFYPWPDGTKLDGIKPSRRFFVELAQELCRTKSEMFGK
uniref:O-succinylbenzoate--CoA ligase n=1 Tax=Candidatus Desulfatibia profunda TaxID=2841695 RepID=A0A8J6NNU9_9BACT|nr:o-succinylbenzoate--CoA ligase [Candidatus Desulfatibia profunda]